MAMALDLTPPIYMRHEDVPPPARFLAIVDALRSYINSDLGIDLSERRFLIEFAKVGRSYLSGFRVTLRTKPERKIETDTINAIVVALNEMLPDPQKWDLAHAYTAAGRTDALEDLRPTLRLMHGTNRDTMPSTIVPIASQIFRFDKIEKFGLAMSAERALRFTWTSDMAIIMGKIPGYDVQEQTGADITIMQRPENTEGLDNAWALVRTSDGSVLARPASDVAPTDLTIAWLLGVIITNAGVPTQAEVGTR